MEEQQVNFEQYEQHYNEDSFWEKIKKYSKKAGKKVILVAMKLYYALQSDATPPWAKAVIVGALGYFVLPADLISDFIPAVGFSDDMAAMSAALLTVAHNITPEVEEKAKKKLQDWFGEEEQ